MIGPNGAGKTTCFNLLTKFLQPTRGTIRFNNIDITGDQPAKIARRGIVRSFQISAVFPHLTVLENVRIALQRKLGASFHFWRSDKTLSRLDGRAVELLAEVGLEAHLRMVAVELPYGQKRALEIATTLALEPELILLDEPTVQVKRWQRRLPRCPLAATVQSWRHKREFRRGADDRDPASLRSGPAPHCRQQGSRRRRSCRIVHEDRMCPP